MPKATNLEVQQRTLEVYHQLLLGSRRVDILQYAAKWNVSSRTIDDYIRRANTLFEKQALVVRDRELGKALDRLTYLFKKALSISDYKTALAVQKEFHALLGLTSPKQVAFTGALRLEWIDPLAGEDEIGIGANELTDAGAGETA